MLVLSSVKCLVSLSVFLLVLGVGVKLRVCVGEYNGDSGDSFCFLCSGDLCVLCSSVLLLLLVDACVLCLIFLSPVSIFSRGSSVSSSDVISVSLLLSSSEENGLVLKNDWFDGGDLDFDRDGDLEGDRVCDIF